MACHCRGRVVPGFIAVVNFVGCDHDDKEMNLRQEIPEGSFPVHSCCVRRQLNEEVLPSLLSPPLGLFKRPSTLAALAPAN
mmetsp:Transcript_9022/g.20984  ORF Transcript_9022/g.20984 Transcript_9022/m.20984 type:complete len:81 (-) Transcript_9022:206-448(-)